MASTLKLPVGIENFEEIRKLGFYYIDKTRLIEKFLQIHLLHSKHSHSIVNLHSPNVSLLLS